jgi:hypothetical protein
MSQFGGTGIFSRNGATRAQSSSKPTVLFSSVALAMILNACGNQDPAFKEERFMTARTSEADASANRAGAMGSEDGTYGNGGDGSSGEGLGDGSSGDGTSGDGTSGDGTSGGAGSDGAGQDGSGGGAGSDETVAGNAGGNGGSGGTGSGSGSGSGWETVGEGVGGFQLMEQTFTQRSAGKVDILWIVDSSGSMSEEQTNLGQNFQAFINQLSATGADFQTGVTSTDICPEETPADLNRVCPVNGGGSTATRHRGSLVGTAGDRVLKKGDPNIVSKFTSYTNVGINGSGFEHGLNAAAMAVAKSISGQNEGLVRPDAFLAVIVVSDEEDDGIGLGMTDAYNGNNYVQLGLTNHRYTHNDFVSSLTSVKGAGKFSVSTITGTRNVDGTMCSAAHSQPLEEGTQYIAAANATGGIVQSICATNWNQSLATIGQDLNAQQSQIALSGAPDVATIKVWVNGVMVNTWTYQSGNNSVKFNAGSVPAPGASVKIQYYKQM